MAQPDFQLGSTDRVFQDGALRVVANGPRSANSPLLEIGSASAEGRAALYVAREPGGANVRNIESTTLALPRGVFGHIDRNARVTVEARLPDGSPLPSWISINPQAGQAIVRPPAGFVGTVEIRLIAHDEAGNSAGTTYTIIVRERKVELQTPAPYDPRLVPFGYQNQAELVGEVLQLFVGASSVQSPNDGSSVPTYTPESGRVGLSHMLALAALERTQTSLMTPDAHF
jgi:hypothetical protein